MTQSRLLSLLAVTALAVPAAAVATTPSERPDSTVLVIAHRGAAGLAPEHTQASYDLAVALGADYLEQDAQSTADGVLVSLHDQTLDRTARGPAENCTGAVRSKTLAQLRTCDMGSWFNEAYPAKAKPEYLGQRILTIGEIFARYAHRGVAFHVETKDTSPDTDRELLRLLDVHGLRGPAHTDWRVLVQSFSPSDLIHLRALDPALPTVQLLAAVPPAGAGRDAVLDRIAGYADGIGPTSGGVDAVFVAAAHSRCLQVQPYTVDSASELQSLVAAGVDGVFTNRTDVLDQVLFSDRSQVRAADAGLRNAAAAAARSRACRAS